MCSYRVKKCYRYTADNLTKSCFLLWGQRANDTNPLLTRLIKSQPTTRHIHSQHYIKSTVTLNRVHGRTITQDILTSRDLHITNSFKHGSSLKKRLHCSQRTSHSRHLSPLCSKRKHRNQAMKHSRGSRQPTAVQCVHDATRTQSSSGHSNTTTNQTQSTDSNHSPQNNSHNTHT